MFNPDWKVEIIKSDRKSIAIQLHPDMTITVRAPYQATEAELNDLIEKKKKWITQHMEAFQRLQEQQETEEPLKPFTREEIEELADRACQELPGKIAHFAKLIGVTYGKITVRNQRTRWGSCSSKGNLNFNCLLMMAPDYVIDYLVVHELCHRKEMNHSKAFWQQVEKILPDYREAEQWLKSEGSLLMRRMR